MNTPQYQIVRTNDHYRFPARYTYADSAEAVRVAQIGNPSSHFIIVHASCSLLDIIDCEEPSFRLETVMVFAGAAIVLFVVVNLILSL